eukprot:Gregarina_sp_Poly_1__5206@NODE_275_length_10210_cov_177_124618_g240_i0_p1_GENE_NODE_275_length_10210_cov_177_124618_g240_i0NODE_275_length_10210_cov_177_124618_g240_i0_p1_ORF_typecomplete_len1872_score305_73SNF2_N/PF00176_23/1_5e67Helicase_C/PF00271_31/3_4e22HDA23/PF11496_8/1_8e21Chromo/PF00385_24/4_6e06Chromo/PF00385_24/2_4e05ResIII/PF04851_15/1_4e13ERCC3_RAD25_C/PF16203_5/1_1e03ERCC3_RAD25_C/PF16203_5/1_1e09Cdh1_DBD_1/PF18196_1/8_8e05CHDCT2/PF08074_11/4_6e03CHDCT2/PF08074_11/0_0008CDH1_2_SANT_
MRPSYPHVVGGVSDNYTQDTVNMSAGGGQPAYYMAQGQERSMSYPVPFGQFASVDGTSQYGQRMAAMMPYQPASTQSFQTSGSMHSSMAGLFMPQQSQVQNPAAMAPPLMNPMGTGHYLTPSHAAMIEMYRRSAMIRQAPPQPYGAYQQGGYATQLGPQSLMYAPTPPVIQQPRLSTAQPGMGMMGRRIPPSSIGLTELQRKPGKPPPRRPPPRSGPQPVDSAQGPIKLLSSGSVPKPARGKPKKSEDDPQWGYDDTFEEDNDDDDDDYDPKGTRKKSVATVRPSRASIAKRKRAIKTGDESFDASEASSSAIDGHQPRGSRRAAAQSNWATSWALGEESPGIGKDAMDLVGGSESLNTRSSRKRKIWDRRRGLEDGDWGPEEGSSDAEDETWTSDVESSGVGTRSGIVASSSGIKRRKAGRGRSTVQSEAVSHQSPELLDDDDDDDEHDGAGYSIGRRKNEPCILDCPVSASQTILGVDRVVNHRDDLIDSETGKLLHVPTESNPPTPGLDSSNNMSAVAPSGETPSNATKVRRYLIKWQGRSHLHNSWLSHEEIQTLQVTGIKKVSNYMKKQIQIEQKKLSMSEDEIEQMVIGLELQKQLDQDALIPERIVTHLEVDAPAAETADTEMPLLGNDTNSTSGDLSNSMSFSPKSGPKKQTILLVKWTSCPYDQCTWEAEEFMVELGFEPLVATYRERESRIHGPLSAHLPLNQHDMSETSFEPYTSTPKYLGTPEKNLTLRDYQLTGVNWIISRMKKDLSVLLADEMGLGKTAQTISVVGHMAYEEKVAGPFLIVVPQSTMDNWLSEFQTWLPNANVVLYHGNPQAREIVRREEMKVVTAAPMSRVAFDAFIQTRSKLTNLPAQQLRMVIANRVRYRCDVIITTTSILQCPEDLAHLRSIPWYFMAVDEAHQLKNRESKRFKELCQFRPRYKLLLSGTPLHNNLEELWSLLHFMNPTLYHSLQQFQQTYSEVEKTESVGELKARQLNQLQRDLSEVVLRRVKRDVLKSLPSKIEWILRVELSPKQSELCKDVVLRNYESLSKSTGGQKLSLQNVCVELKKICNHPFLLHRPEDRETFNKELLWSSGKMCLLDKLLNRLKDKGHRVLIFSQMVRMLNLLSTFLTIRGFKHQRLDGTMSRDVRKKAMDHFNAPNSDDFCFLLSTKAGGLGINLTSADTVIIYDSDWNPQNDLQAEARAHRIGQTKTVQIYRVVTKDSVEEDILERAKAKMVLDALVVQGLNVKAGIRENDLLNGTGGAGSKNSAFSREELTKILMFGATKLWNKKEDHEKPSTDKSQQNLEGGINIDLDAVLAEAEEHTTDTSGGRAEDLLSSFQNVSDFRYEAPKAKEEDKLAWDSIIPLEDRLKFASHNAETTTGELAIVTSRSRGKAGSQRAAAKRSAKDRSLKELETAGGDEEDYHIPDPEDYESEEDDSSEAPRTRKRGLAGRRRSTKAGGGAASRSGAVSRVGSRRGDRAPPPKKAGLSDRERYKLSRAMIKYGTPAIRLEDVMKDARLVKIDGQTVVEEANALLVQCQEELSSQCGAGEVVRLTASQGKLGVVEQGPSDGRKKVTLVSLQWGNGYSCPCRELLDRVELLKSLHNVVASQNIHTDEPWKLPSQELVLELPDLPTFKHGDANILKGIYLHGFANWQRIASDQGLAVGVDDFVKRVKSDKIKVKANKLLNAVHALATKESNEPMAVATEEATVSEPFRVSLMNLSSQAHESLTPSDTTAAAGEDDIAPTRRLFDTEGSDQVLMEEEATEESKIPKKKRQASDGNVEAIQNPNVPEATENANVDEIDGNLLRYSKCLFEDDEPDANVKDEGAQSAVEDFGRKESEAQDQQLFSEDTVNPVSAVTVRETEEGEVPEECETT